MTCLLSATYSFLRYRAAIAIRFLSIFNPYSEVVILLAFRANFLFCWARAVQFKAATVKPTVLLFFLGRAF